MKLIKNSLKIVLKFTAYSLLFTQIACTPHKSNDLITIASNGKIESLDPAQANKLLAMQKIFLELAKMV